MLGNEMKIVFCKSSSSSIPTSSSSSPPSTLPAVATSRTSSFYDYHKKFSDTNVMMVLKIDNSNKICNESTKNYNNKNKIIKNHNNNEKNNIRENLMKCLNNILKPSQKHVNIYWMYTIFFYFILTQYWINGKILPDDSGPLSEVQTAVGLEVFIPCDLMPGTITSEADKVQLVIWYKEGNVKPIYTFDARGKPLQQAVHWADQDLLKEKAHFYYDTNPPALRIKGVEKDDAGLYRCRVDFHKSPTRNWRINLTVLVPPSQLIILDTFGAAVTDNVVGPYSEGSNINLTCLSSGGIPPPRVSWWKEHALLDDSFQILPDGTVRNILHLSKISRKDLNTVYTCQASNGHVVPPLSNTVKLDMKLPPLYIRLQGLNHPLVAGVRTQITCSSAGARPSPQIIWNKGGLMMKGATQTTSSDGNVTISELVFVPVPEDNGKQVICSVTADSLSSGSTGVFLKDSRTLDVKHAPIVSLNLGAPLDPNNLMKGSDVYLECDIKANPPAKKIEWYHNDKQLHSSRGIIISNQTLVLQGISKSTHGQYLCRGTNIQGTVASNEVYLDVKYSPVCKSESTIIRAALKQTVNITCDVDSNPIYNLTYKWHFNNSLETIVELPQLSSSGNSGGSILLPPPSNNGVKNNDGIISDEPSIRGGINAGGHVNGRNSNNEKDLLNGILDGYNNDGVVGIIGDGEWPLPDDNDEDDEITTELNVVENLSPYSSQMVYSNLVYQQHLDKNRKYHGRQKQQQQQTSSAISMGHYSFSSHGAGGVGGGGSGVGINDAISNNNNAILEHKKKFYSPSNGIYRYRVDTFSHYGTVSCIASNSIGHSTPCLYHIIAAELPDPVKNCTAYNATANSIQIFCIPGTDGGIQQLFHVEVYDELNRQILYNTSYRYSDFTIKRLPSDSVFVIRVTSYNLQGFSNRAFRLRAKTLSAPLLRTASSTAVLVQLTPLLGALVGVIATLILVAICIIIFIKFRTKHHTRHNNNENGTTETDKGSAEPLSRNMGSHSSLEDKNPDVIPQENSEDEYNLEEKAFDRLNIESQRILYTPPRLNSTTSTQQQRQQQSPQISPTFAKQYGELSLTTNPSFALYNSPTRAPALQRPIYTAPPQLLSTRTPSNIYTRIPPTRNYLPAYETRTSPTSPYGTTTASCTVPLLSKQQQQQQQLSPIQSTNIATLGTGSSLTLQHHQQHQQHQQQQTQLTTPGLLLGNIQHQPSPLLITSGGGILGNYDEKS